MVVWLVLPEWMSVTTLEPNFTPAQLRRIRCCPRCDLPLWKESPLVAEGGAVARCSGCCCACCCCCCWMPCCCWWRKSWWWRWSRVNRAKMIPMLAKQHLVYHGIPVWCVHFICPRSSLLHPESLAGCAWAVRRQQAQTNKDQQGNKGINSKMLKQPGSGGPSG